MELASGYARESQLRKMILNKNDISFHVAEFPPELRSGAISDWERARGKLWFQLSAKLKYWSELPWQLCDSALLQGQGRGQGPGRVFLFLQMRYCTAAAAMIRS